MKSINHTNDQRPKRISTDPHDGSRSWLVGLMTAGLIAAVLASSTSAQASTGQVTPQWRPQVSEKLVKMPNAFLKKTLDKDFRASALALALADVGEEVGFKKQTLADLRQAREQAQGDLKIELDHQFLAEKKAYLDLVVRQQDLKRKHVKTRIEVYERMLQKMGQAHSGRTTSQAKLAERQAAAHARFTQSAETVDVALFEESVAQQSKYAKEYTKNLTAIRSLAAAIDNHAVTRKVQDDAASQESKPDYLRGLISGAEADLALLNQEGEIVGYMAKLVALDAQALAENVQDQVVEIDDMPKDQGLADVVELYIQ